MVRVGVLRLFELRFGFLNCLHKRIDIQTKLPLEELKVLDLPSN
jgi:hypothetical protein